MSETIEPCTCADPAVPAGEPVDIVDGDGRWHAYRDRIGAYRVAMIAPSPLWEAKQEAVAKMNRLEELRQKRRAGKALTAAEKTEALDLLMGV